MSESHILPPPLTEPVSTIELDSVKGSKITGVSVYSTRAEVTRLFRFKVKTGQNQVNIAGLPAVLDQDSFRVEGRGAATIHDVTISKIERPPTPTTSTALRALSSKKTRLEKALYRSKKSLEALEAYLESLKLEHLEPSRLKLVVESYDTAAEELDSKITALEESIGETEQAIDEETASLSGPTENEKLNLRASIGVFADAEGEVEIALIYAVSSATWSAGYDIRVDMQTKENPVTLIYKGSITQSTGEDWNDVHLVLETAAPTFGLDLPTLTPWTLSLYSAPVYKSKSRRAVSYNAPPAPLMSAPPGSTPAPQYDYPLPELSALVTRELNVSSKGNITATFSVPGLMTIPSDGDAHSVTIVRLSLDAKMSWVAVPKIDTKVHLKAKIKNASEYTLLDGQASVYVDGSFISKTQVPLVSPEESFDCPLGLDPTIRVTYHPRSKKISQSGFFLSSKTSTNAFSQRVTVYNTKKNSIDDFKIVDQLPVSENSQITVKVDTPALTLPGDSTTNELKLPPPTKIANGVIAQWDGADEDGADVEGLGKDGKFNWICSIPAQGKINLLLQWEVTYPVKTAVVGL